MDGLISKAWFVVSCNTVVCSWCGFDGSWCGRIAGESWLHPRRCGHVGLLHPRRLLANLMVNVIDDFDGAVVAR